VLAGVGGSDPGHRAVLWAAADAAARNSRLTLVRVHETWLRADVPVPPEVRAGAEREDRDLLARAVTAARSVAPA
jgi:hypothetical protein